MSLRWINKNTITDVIQALLNELFRSDLFKIKNFLNALKNILRDVIVIIKAVGIPKLYAISKIML